MTELAQVVNEMVGQGLSTDEIVERLNSALVSHGIVFEPKSAKDLSLNSDEIQSNTAGGGTMDDGEIVVYYDSDHGLEEVFDGEEPESIKNFLTAVRNVVEHELVHREQLDKSSGKIKGDKPHNVVAYLSNPAEAMAMARQCVNQFLDLGYQKQQILQLLRAPWRRTDGVPGRGESDIFWNYTEWFDGKDPDFQRFVKYMVDYLTSDFSET